MTSCSREGRLVSHQGKTLLVASLDDETLVSCTGRRQLGRLVCGDRVVWEPVSGDAELGVVVQRKPRLSELIRPDFRGRTRVVAANLERLFIVMAPQPAPDLTLLRRALSVALIQGLEPWLVLNKTDLDRDGSLAELARQYAPLGLPVLKVSAHSGAGLDALQDALAGRESMLAGQSGVGKSSLTAALLPEKSLRVGAVSSATGHGRHTTSTAIRHALPDGGGLIDAPGVRDFALWPMPAEQFLRAFPEFGDLPGQCRFNDCRHLGEPGCAVRAAVDEGALPALRYAIYTELVETACPLR